MILAIDTETTGTDFFHGCRPFMVTACDGDYNYIWSGRVNPDTRDVSWSPSDLADINEVINSYDQILFHNTNFDRRALESINIYTDHLVPRMEDTLVLSHVLCNGDIHGLKDLAIKYLRYYDDDEQNLQLAVVSERNRLRDTVAIARLGHPHFPAASSTTTWWKQDMWLAQELCATYATKDTERTWLLWETFRQAFFEDYHTPEVYWTDLYYTPFTPNQMVPPFTRQLTPQVPLTHTSGTNLLAQYRFRMSLLPVLYDICSHGINVYHKKLNRLIDHLEFQLTGLVNLIKHHSNWTGHLNPESPKHLALLLHRNLSLPIINTTETGQPSTDKKTLAMMFESYPDCIALRYLAAWSETSTELSFLHSYRLWDHATP